MCSQQAAKAEPTVLRIFLASPGDVANERALVRKLLKEELPYDPFLRGRVTFDVISWDDPAARTPMPARLTPQEAVIRFETRPSDCDVVVVVLWSRLGTHLDLTKFHKPNGDPYLSGTEWEYEDARKGKPEIFIYRRTEVPKVDLNDPDYEEKRRQYHLVRQFCEHISQNPDGSFRGNVTDYDTPTAFEERLATDLKRLLRDRLDECDAGSAVGEAPAPVWTGSPYPGLRSFTMEEGPIFFGRGREVDALIARLRDPAQRFLAVVGASGTGKSSLVRAGLLPRLAEGAIEGSQHWCVLTFTPAEVSDHPLQALATKLSEVLPPGHRKPAREIAMALTKAPQWITEYAAMILAGRPAGAALVLVIDQLEEVFTLVTAAYRAALIDLLTHAAGDPRLRVLATVRADFLPQCMAEPQLLALLQPPASTYLLGPPRLGAFADIIRKPAERAGLDLEEGLVEEILTDAGTNPGALPLVAFCLQTLYCPNTPRHRLTLRAYEDLGRLRGAIGRQANALLENFRRTEGASLDTALPQLFRALVHIDAAGTATRRRAFHEELSTEPSMPRLVEALVQGRLLVAEETGGRATITLGHEVLLATWPDLCEWLERNRAQMQRLQMWLLGLEAPNASDRRRAAEALGEMGPMASKAVPTLITALGDANEDVRWNAAAALGQIGLAAAEAVPALIITALGGANEDIRSRAAEVLGQIGPAAAEAVPALITALGAADEDVRWNAAAALGQIGPAAAEAVPALITALGDTGENVRWNAAEALGQIGPAAVPTLITALGAADENVRWSAIKALGQIGPAAAEAVPALITAALKDPDKNIARAANTALKRIRSASPERQGQRMKGSSPIFRTERQI